MLTTLGGPSNSTLVWTPNQVVTIDPTTYRLTFDQGTSSIGAVNNTSINAIGTPVPEPSTYALTPAGLAGLGLVARRRRTV